MRLSSPSPSLLTLRGIALTGMMLLGVLAAPARADHTPEDAGAFIQNLAQEAITTVADRQIADQERADRFRRLFVASFDLPEISRFVLARYWRAATPDQQQIFVKLFEDMQVLNWTQRFKDYKGESLEVTASSKDGDRSYTVESLLNHPPAQPMQLQWRVHQTDDNRLQVTDIIVEGASMAITNRSDYNSLLQANGGKIDALLSALKSKVDQMKSSSN